MLHCYYYKYNSFKYNRIRQSLAIQVLSSVFDMMLETLGGILSEIFSTFGSFWQS